MTTKKKVEVEIQFDGNFCHPPDATYGCGMMVLPFLSGRRCFLYNTSLQWTKRDDTIFLQSGCHRCDRCIEENGDGK